MGGATHQARKFKALVALMSTNNVYVISTEESSNSLKCSKFVNDRRIQKGSLSPAQVGPENQEAVESQL